MNGVIHDFRKDLEWSADLGDEAAWVAFYQEVWPDMVMAVRIDKDSQWQRWGVDRMVLLQGGRQILIDEKKRAKDYGDLLLEEWSVGRMKNGVFVGEKKGWALDEGKRVDFIAYAIPTAGRCFLLPFELLRQAVRRNLEAWKQNSSWYPKDAFNPTWITRNVAVPWEVLREALMNQMQRPFAAVRELPLPVHESFTQRFEWKKE